MNILSLIFENLRRGPVSFRLPHKHMCTSDQYRGLIINDAERCVGCAQCAYVCPSGSIEVTRNGDQYTWSYDPGKCAFCGSCIDRCKPRTLTMESQLPPLYGTEGELKQVLHMTRKRPVRPAAPAKKEAAKPAADTAQQVEKIVPPATSPAPTA
jgi:formate hydrogenlyase subunit 6/NADH:ubiquinone oxidoreductase subunit I